MHARQRLNGFRCRRNRGTIPGSVEVYAVVMLPVAMIVMHCLQLWWWWQHVSGKCEARQRRRMASQHHVVLCGAELHAASQVDLAVLMRLALHQCCHCW